MPDNFVFDAVFLGFVTSNSVVPCHCWVIVLWVWTISICLQ